MSSERYVVMHRTRYRYAWPVTLSRQLLHLTPRKTPRQRTQAHRIDIDPPPVERESRSDYFGNAIEQLTIAQTHDTLEVFSHAIVDVGAAECPQTAVSPPWEHVRDRLRQVGTAPLLEPCQFVYTSPHVEPLMALARYARLDFHRGRPMLDATLALMRRIHRDFEFDPEATTVSTPLETLLREKRGVCQDLAHFMIGCLRSLGLPARYVSGYLLTEPPPGQPRLIGADASHAWVSVFCPGQGWLDVDPTNCVQPGKQHITLAWGRDFSDVTPMRGVILGGGEHTVDVSVTVLPEHEAGTAELLRKATQPLERE
ncbi:transglutaminase family protein [Methyloversatilis thermotolerans]|uniref:transglutaminase family protein n=1 Tax=Methyloversatilis thermotolerans TaxID=1346290 RepID=UPI000378E957|nr:transglutaminase family protein [Methyloversatilis thermotolerans]